MRDLESRLFYSTCFEVKGNDENIFSFVVTLIWNWLKSKADVTSSKNSRHWNYTQFQKYGDFCSLDKNVTFSTTSFPKNSSDIPFCWAIRIIEKQVTKTAPRDWITEIAYEHIGVGQARISLICAYKDFNAYIGLLDEIPTNTTPRILHSLLCHPEYKAYSGSLQLTTYPKEIKVGDVPEVFDNVIYDPNRRCPIIIIGALQNSDRQIPVINPPGDLQYCVLGNANIFYIRDIMVHEEMYHVVARTEHCPIGCIKVYMPLDKDKDNLKIHFLSCNDIQELNQNQILQIIRRAMSQHIVAEKNRLMLRYEDCIDRFRHDHFCKMVQKLDNSALTKEEWGHWCHEYEQLEQQRDDLFSQLMEATIQKEELEYENQKLTNSARIARDAQQDAFKEKKLIEESLAARRIKCAYPERVQDVVDFFASHYSDHIVFTDRCYRTLDNCVTRADIVWNCLNDIVFILHDLYENDVPNIDGDFDSKSTFELATGEGSLTRCNASLMRLREDDYKGRKIILEPHVKKRGGGLDSDPQQIRIYFDYIRELNLIAIGHIGGHLLNATSSKVS